jgi:hypothetical protein
MQRLKTALEQLDEMISALEDRVILDASARQEAQKKQADILKSSRAREANMLAVAQKVASRLDQTIEHVERIVRN